MSRHFALAAFLAFVVLMISSCSQPKDPEPDPVFAEVPITERTRAVDLLFVIGTSNSMQEEQALLARHAEWALRELIETSEVSDLHVGVLLDVMDIRGWYDMMCPYPLIGQANGQLYTSSRREGCASPYFASDCGTSECPWLTHSAEHPDVGAEAGNPPIWEDFACIVSPVDGGCHKKNSPLEAIEVALTDLSEPGRPNEGFLRHDSVLALVIVTERDDCSVANLEMYNPTRDEFGPMNTRCANNPDELHPIERYTDALRDLRPFDEDLLVVAAITDVPIDGSWSPDDPIEDLRDLQRVNPENPNELIPSCMTDMGLAFPPVRLAEFISSFDNAGILGSICRDDWSDTMMAIARAIQSRMIYECYELSEDIDPATECRLIEILSDGTEREIPHEAEGVEGWSIGSTARGCPSGQLQFSDGVEIDGEVRLECVVVEEE